MALRKAQAALAAMLVLLAGGALLVQQRGAGTEMTEAARAFLATLTEEQRKIALLDYDAPQRLDWHYIPKDYRKGLQLRDMDEPQRQAAHALLRSCLSKVGYEKAELIMELEKILQALEGPQARFKRDYLRYYFTLFGQPDVQGTWGLSIEGHHLSLNFVVRDGRLLAHTPAMFGANPALVASDVEGAPRRGTRVLKDEEVMAFELLHLLSPQQRQRAVIAEKAPADIRAAGEPQPPQAPPEGLPASEMNAQQVKQLRGLIGAYLENMPREIAQRRMDEIERAGIEQVHFAWAGADRPGVGHYYRLQGPTFLVEFCNTQPDAAGNPANHIHSVWRDLRGDFGIALKK
jgi:hypothetical protein